MDLAIIGYGELGREVYELAQANGMGEKWERIFFVDLFELKESNVMQEKNFFEYSDRNNVEIIIAMGEPVARKKMRELYEEKGFQMASFIHPLAWISPNARIGKGTIVFPFVYIAHGTNIGNNSLIHTHAVIENDCVIGRDTFISSSSFIGAKTIVEDSSFVGPEATVRDSVEIGNDSIVGLGAVVTRNIEAKSVVVGNPARKLRDNIKGTVFKQKL